MENLAIDLKNALDLNLKIKKSSKNLNMGSLSKPRSKKDAKKAANKRHMKKANPKQSNKNTKKNNRSIDLNRAYKQSTFSDKKKNLMKVLIAAVSTSPISELNTQNLNNNNLTNDQSNNKISNLYRFKKLLNNSRSASSHRSQSRKATKNTKLYKIHKVYRFRNYKMRCIRLRQFQQREKRLRGRFNCDRSQQQLKLNNFLFNETLNRKNMSQSSLNSSTSCMDSSDNSNLSSSSSSSQNSSTSLFTSDCDSSSLVECFTSAKFLNSSCKEDSDKSTGAKWTQLNIKKSKKKLKSNLKNKFRKCKFKTSKKMKTSSCDCRHCKGVKVEPKLIKKENLIFNYDLSIKRVKRKHGLDNDELKDVQPLSYQIKKMKVKLNGLKNDQEETYDDDCYLNDRERKLRKFSQEDDFFYDQKIKCPSDINSQSDDNEEADDEQSDFPANEENNLIKKLKNQNNLMKIFSKQY